MKRSECLRFIFPCHTCLLKRDLFRRILFVRNEAYDHACDGIQHNADDCRANAQGASHKIPCNAYNKTRAHACENTRSGRFFPYNGSQTRHTKSSGIESPTKHQRIIRTGKEHCHKECEYAKHNTANARKPEFFFLS